MDTLSLTPQDRVLITGATGFVGKRLITALTGRIVEELTVGMLQDLKRTVKKDRLAF